MVVDSVEAVAVSSYTVVADPVEAVAVEAVAVETTEGRSGPLQRHTNSSVSDLSATGICQKANRT